MTSVPGMTDRRRRNMGLHNVFVFFQHLIPHHLLSRVVGQLAQLSWRWPKNWAIGLFIKIFGVDMSEAIQSDYKQFATFNEFFIRHLHLKHRPLTEEAQAIACPVDGVVSEFGELHQNKLLQAKGVYYDLNQLLGNNIIKADPFQNGTFFTAYLSPKDYHRVHMPVTGRLLKMVYVPGRLFSVNAISVRGIDQLFARNERVVCLFETEAGLMVVVLVGAMIVASIHTFWHGVVTPAKSRVVSSWDYHDRRITLEGGCEMGYFNLGSTVIVLFQSGRSHFAENLSVGHHVKMGRKIGSWQ